MFLLLGRHLLGADLLEVMEKDGRARSPPCLWEDPLGSSVHSDPSFLPRLSYCFTAQLAFPDNIQHRAAFYELQSLFKFRLSFTPRNHRDEYYCPSHFTRVFKHLRNTSHMLRPDTERLRDWQRPEQDSNSGLLSPSHFLISLLHAAILIFNYVNYQTLAFYFCMFCVLISVFPNTWEIFLF